MTFVAASSAVSAAAEFAVDAVPPLVVVVMVRVVVLGGALREVWP